MPKPSQPKVVKVTKNVLEPSALAVEYLRSFAASLESFAEFDLFIDRLKALVGTDAYLLGKAALVDPFSGEHALPDFESLGADETIVAVAGQAGNVGYLNYSGRRDRKLFGAQDLHLMGAIAGFISALVHQAHNYRQKSKAEKVLQYLINQLPLGVVCFDSDGRLIVENELAGRILGSEGAGIIEKELSGNECQSGHMHLHFEVDGRLIYSEGKLMSVDDGVTISAYVLYDLSADRAQLTVELDKEAYRSESRGVPLSIAVLESRALAGDVFVQTKKIARSLGLDLRHILPVDAYRCACIFEGKCLCSVRDLLKRGLVSYDGDDLFVSVVGYQVDLLENAPASALLDAAVDTLLPLEQALRPELVVMDGYESVADSLQIILSEVCDLRAESEVDVLVALIHQGRIDGVFFDLDTYSLEDLKLLQAAAAGVDHSFQFYYCTCKRRATLEHRYGLTSKDVVLRKPFDAQDVHETVASQFDLA